jgi:ribosome-associated protein
MTKSKDIIHEIKEALDGKKAEDILILDLRKLTTFTNYFIIATANSEPHLQTLAKDAARLMKQEHKILPLNPISDLDKSWALLDFQDIIVHIFLEDSREYYNLEELWFEAEKI